MNQNISTLNVTVSAAKQNKQEWIAQIIKEIEGMKLAHACTEVKCPHTDWKMFNKALSQLINKLKEEK
jgi:hypothetical protein